jgi:hypothetical protein
MAPAASAASSRQRAGDARQRRQHFLRAGQHVDVAIQIRQRHQGGAGGGLA